MDLNQHFQMLMKHHVSSYYKTIPALLPLLPFWYLVFMNSMFWLCDLLIHSYGISYRPFLHTNFIGLSATVKPQNSWHVLDVTSFHQLTMHTCSRWSWGKANFTFNQSIHWIFRIGKNLMITVGRCGSWQSANDLRSLPYCNLSLKNHSIRGRLQP